MFFQRIQNRVQARLRLRRLGIWYHPGYAAPLLQTSARVPGVIPDRAELALGKLAHEGYLKSGDVRAARAAPFHQLREVHPAWYLEQTADPATLGHIFGLEPHVVDVDAMLDAQRLAVGGTVAATQAVASGTLTSAFNLGGGFHHAAPEQGSGFCVYNDVAIALACLRRDGWDGHALIVDLDYHQGDGNLVAFCNDPAVFTYSIHGSVWSRVAAVADFGVCLPSGTGDGAYLQTLASTLPDIVRSHRPTVAFYLAGNDVLAGDHLGDFCLTPDGVLRRDRFVIELLREHQIGTVVTLAGGYSADAWRCSADLLAWLLSGHTVPWKRTSVDPRLHYNRIARRLDTSKLQQDDGDPWVLTEEELWQDLVESHHRSRKLLDYYSATGVEYALGRYGVLRKLRTKGFSNLRVEVDPKDPSHQVVRISGDKGGSTHALAEIVVRLRHLDLPEGLEGGEPLRLLALEWMQLQDPTRDFTLERPALPGQDHPGLGLAYDVQELLIQACHRLGLDGLVSHPSRFHIAILCGPQYRFLDPTVEGRYRALQPRVAHLALDEASRAIEGGTIAWPDGVAVTWDAKELVLPISPRLQDYFTSDTYLDQLQASQARHEREGAAA